MSATDAPNQNKFDHPIDAQGRSAPGRNRLRTTLRRLYLAGFVGISAFGMTGCTLGTNACKGLVDQECVDEFMIGYRNRAMAEKAWHCRKHQFCETKFAREFKDGFIQGYMEVANGGNGCTPAMAPSTYWGWQYQSGNGHSAINAWFQGFPQGVRAAEEDGVGHWQQVRVSHVGQPAPLPALAAPLAAGALSESDDGVTNPFYPESDLQPQPDPEMFEQLNEPLEGIPPGGVEEIELPLSPEAADSVFDGLFPPVNIGDANELSSKADAIVAEGPAADDAEDESLQFSFE